MMYHYIVVEGPHDVAAVGKILRIIGAVQIKKKKALMRYDQQMYFSNLIKFDFPFNDDMTERIPVPLFFRLGENPNISLVAVHYAQGESALFKTMLATLSNLDDIGENFTSLAVIGDADNRTTEEALTFYKNQLPEAEKLPPIMRHFKNFPKPGLVLERRQRIGVYILPDNDRTGALETVLLECAATKYEDIMNKAEEFVNHFPTTNRSKSIVGCINNILRPGTSNAVSIEKDEWFCSNSMTSTSATRLQFFLKQLLGFEPCSNEKAQ